MKLLAIGTVLLAAAALTLAFSNVDPAALFILGGGCVFLGFVSLLTPSYGRGAPTSSDDARDAIDLTRDIRNHQ